MTTYVVTIKAFGQIRVEKIAARSHAEAIRKARQRHGVSVDAAIAHGAQLLAHA